MPFSGRVDNYSDVGSTRNPRFAVDWKPVDGLLLRPGGRSHQSGFSPAACRRRLSFGTSTFCRCVHSASVAVNCWESSE